MAGQADNVAQSISGRPTRGGRSRVQRSNGRRGRGLAEIPSRPCDEIETGADRHGFGRHWGVVGRKYFEKSRPMDSHEFSTSKSFSRFLRAYHRLIRPVMSYRRRRERCRKFDKRPFAVGRWGSPTFADLAGCPSGSPGRKPSSAWSCGRNRSRTDVGGGGGRPRACASSFVGDRGASAPMNFDYFGMEHPHFALKADREE